MKNARSVSTYNYFSRVIKSCLKSYEVCAKKTAVYNVSVTLMNLPRERRTADDEGQERRKERERRKKRGRGLLTTRLIRTVLFAFYNGTFVSNTDFKKQTLLSQRRRCCCCGCWLRPDCSLFATFVALSLSPSRSLSLFVSFPMLCFFFYFIPGPWL